MKATESRRMFPMKRLLAFAGEYGGVCYMPDRYSDLVLQSDEKKEKRARNALAMGHHSISGHGHTTLVLEGVPKIVAMCLNNEKLYNTSEKSGRYTHFEDTTGLYTKWIQLFSTTIKEEYPNIGDKDIEKLAMENARYLLSVFTPTTFVYTASDQQWNYIYDWCMLACDKTSVSDEEFYVRLAVELREFARTIKPLVYVEELRDFKNRDFSILGGAELHKKDSTFGDVYSTNYRCSFAMLAQAQRHRTLSYEMFYSGLTLQEDSDFYVPKIIRKNAGLVKEWFEDMKRVAYDFPQGMLIDVSERGTIENFLLKCSERKCGRAQLEIHNNVCDTYDKFMLSGDDLSTHDKELLKTLEHDLKCKQDGYVCKEPCRWLKSDKERLI